MSNAEYTVLMLNHLNGNPPSKKDLKMKGDPVKPTSKTKRQVDFKDQNGNAGFRVF
jgi:hypothetical protein